MATDFAPTMLPDAAAVWRVAIEDLSPFALPFRYLNPTKWAVIRENANSTPAAYVRRHILSQVRA
jgi:hypothetical protein